MQSRSMVVTSVLCRHYSPPRPSASIVRAHRCRRDDDDPPSIARWSREKGYHGSCIAPPPWYLLGGDSDGPAVQSKEGAMEYLVEVRWEDPIADKLCQILADGLKGVEQSTSYLPVASSRAFVVYRSDRLDLLQSMVEALSNAGGKVSITPVAQNLMPM